MKTLFKLGIAMTAVLALGGCVYGPDYGYVRGDGYYGDAYYGAAPVYYDYYGPGYSYYGPGYYYGPSIGLGFYYDDYGRGRRWNHGGWNGGGRWNGGGGWATRPSTSVPRPSYNRSAGPSRPNRR